MFHPTQWMFVATALAFPLTACKSDAPRESAQQPPTAGQAAADSARRAAEAAAARLQAALTPRTHFDFDKSAVRADARAVLDAKVQALKGSPAARIRVSGHCDERGSERYNQALGLRRAEAAKQYLVRGGINAARIDVVSFGESRPLDPAHTRPAWAANRRAEFELLAGAAARP